MKKAKSQIDRRIIRLTNKLAFLRATLAAMRGCSVSNRAHICAIARDATGFYNVEEWIEEVEEKLDSLVEPANPFVEWISDIGIHVAAAVAVYLYTRREQFVEDRIGRIEHMLAAAMAKRDAAKKKKAAKKPAAKKAAKKPAAKKAAKKPAAKKAAKR